MYSKGLRLQLLGRCFVSRGLLRALLFASAIGVFTLMQNLYGPEFETGSFGSMQFEETVNLTANVVGELMEMQMLSRNAKALCVGEGSSFAVLTLREMGIPNAYGVHRNPFFSLKKKKQIVHELDHDDNSFDFVFFKDLDRVSVPAILVIESERVLKPGGVGALLVGVTGSNSNSLIRSATHVSSTLKSSDIVHVGHVNGLSLIIFKKKIEIPGYFQQIQLPADCKSVINNKHLIHKMEHLVEQNHNFDEKRFAYLPNFENVSAKKRLVYVDIGAGEHLSSNGTDWWLPSYPIDREAFDIYFVDHNTSVLLSYVKRPGITFVYHPGLAGKTANPTHPTNPTIHGVDVLEPDWYVEDDGFDFLGWFKETVRDADFVVLKMNASAVDLKFLSEMFESGAICSVDEMFLLCSEGGEGGGAEKGSCLSLYKDLRSSGVFVHQL